MCKHEEKYCPQCNIPFTCKVGDIAHCGCTQVKLSDETRAFLAKTHFDCLCPDCLARLNEAVKTTRQYRFPTQKEMLIEGLHYYKEGNYWVFTEFYHILRGYCCGSGCRHCAYGFKKMP